MLTEDSSGHLMVKLFAVMLLAYFFQNIFCLGLCTFLLYKTIYLSHGAYSVREHTQWAGLKDSQYFIFTQGWTNISRDSFCLYVVCPKCMATYTLEESYTIIRTGSKISNICGYISFHKHPQKKLGHKCGILLMKMLICWSGKEYLYPIRVYCYKEFTQSLETFVRRSGFLEKCEQWRHRNMPVSVMGDLAGLSICQWPFLAEPSSFALMMNVDWYQPFKHIFIRCHISCCF